MSRHTRRSQIDESCADGAEVLELGHGNLPAGSVAEFEPVEIPCGERHRARLEPGEQPTTPGRSGIVVAMAFAVGLGTGIVALQAGDGVAAGSPAAEVDLKLETAAPTGEPVAIGTSYAVLPVEISVVNAGRNNVTVLGVSLAGWTQDEFGSTREAVDVMAGLENTVATGVPLDCSQPKPPTPTTAEVRMRTEGIGVIILHAPLNTPARNVATHWERFCAGQQ